MRFCELIKEDLSALAELPDSNQGMEEKLGAYKKAREESLR